MAKNKITHVAYTGLTTRGYTVLKCLCGFETVKPTETEARKAHDEATKQKAAS